MLSPLWLGTYIILFWGGYGGNLFRGIWHTWRATHGICMLLLALISIFEDASWRVHMDKALLAIFGYHLGGCTNGEMFYFFRGSWPHPFLWSTPFAWHLADSSMEFAALHVDWLHASCGLLSALEEVVIEHSPRRKSLYCLFSCVSGGCLNGFSWVNFGAHPPLWRVIVLYLACTHSWMVHSMWTLGIWLCMVPIFCVHPLYEQYLVHASMYLYMVWVGL